MDDLHKIEKSYNIKKYFIKLGTKFLLQFDDFTNYILVISTNFTRPKICHSFNTRSLSVAYGW